MAKFTYLYAMPPIAYAEDIIRLVRMTLGSCDSICYVTFTKTAGMVRTAFTEAGIDGNICFIDGISTAILTPTEDPNTTYLRYPLDAAELERAVERISSERHCAAFIFDSISALAMQQDQERIILALSRIVASLVQKKTVAIFTCFMGDLERPLVAHVAMNVDKVVEMRE